MSIELNLQMRTRPSSQTCLQAADTRQLARRAADKNFQTEYSIFISAGRG